MKEPIYLLVLLLAYPGIVTAEDKPNAVSKLKDFCAKPNQLPESLVRPAALLVQEQYLNKPWDTVRSELVAEGLRVPEGRDSQYVTMYDIPVATNVLRVGSISFDLVLEFEVDKRTKAEAPTARHSRILAATASLQATAGNPTADVISSKVFPLNSVIGRALSAAVRQKEDGGYSVLKRIDISYDLIRHHRESEWPYGYHLSLFFGRPAEEEWRKRIFLTVVSSEDLPRDRDHNVVKKWQGWLFTGLDTVQIWGSEETP